MNIKPDGWLGCCDRQCQRQQRRRAANETWDLLWSSGIYEVIMNIKQSCFSGAVFTVSRLVTIMKQFRQLGWNSEAGCCLSQFQQVQYHVSEPLHCHINITVKVLHASTNSSIMPRMMCTDTDQQTLSSSHYCMRTTHSTLTHTGTSVFNVTVIHLFVGLQLRYHYFLSYRIGTSTGVQQAACRPVDISETVTSQARQTFIHTAYCHHQCQA